MTVRWAKGETKEASEPYFVRAIYIGKLFTIDLKLCNE